MSPRRYVPVVTGVLCLSACAVRAETSMFATVPTAVPPEKTHGVVFVPLRPLAEAVGATVEWLPSARSVAVSGNGRRSRFALGTPKARVDGRTVAVGAAPYLRRRHTMVPVGFAAHALSTPIRYDAPTESVIAGPKGDGILLLLTMPSQRPGFVIHSPRPNSLAPRGVWIQGQANLMGGRLVLRLETTEGRVLSEGAVTYGSGSYVPFMTALHSVSTERIPSDARVVALFYRPGDDQPCRQQVIPVRYSPEGPDTHGGSES